MKYVFLAGLALLVIASMLTAWNMPDMRSDVPVIYWVTDSNPARKEQVRLFHEWLLSKGHTKTVILENRGQAAEFVDRNRSKAIRKIIANTMPKGQALLDGTLADSDFPLNVRLPVAELRLDMANADPTKKLIQGVSGVAGDIQDMGSGAQMRYFRAIGLNTDVTEKAKELGFDTSITYPSIENEIALHDESGAMRQYQFPCNVTASMFMVNREMFRQHGQEIPPKRWSIEEFESRGKAFVAAANKGRARQTVFFANGVPQDILRSSLGGSRFNETATEPTLSCEAGIKAWSKIYQWTYVDHILPSAADSSSFTVDSGYGGQVTQLFNNQDPARGQIAMIFFGRYFLIEFRKYDEDRKRLGKPLMDVAVVEPPNGGFPNTSIVTRAAMVYAGSKHQDLAALFLAFLASEEYNMQIVRDADSLPPNPKYTKIEEYLRPADHPNEWDVHGAFADAATELAVPAAHSPFILSQTVDRLEKEAQDFYMADRKTVQEATRLGDEKLKDEMERTMLENPALVPLYEKLVARQKLIDEKKKVLMELEAAGKLIPKEAKIPMEWLENAYYKSYYKFKGWAE